ncbi:MAG: hypothetical protein ACR2GL_05175 [Thermoleophilaceae bacterium]
MTVQPNTPKPTASQQAEPRLGVPGTTPYVPPLHGANPHGQGTVGTIDLGPSATRPLPVDETTGETLAPNGEEIVVGRSRGEQRADGRYHGHITILSLFGNEIAGVDTNEGETKDGPVQSIQQNVLDPLCPGGIGLICLQLVRAHSETTASSSSNEFKATGLAVASAVPGGGALAADVAESRGNISSDGTCQTAHGDSLLTGVTIGAGATVLPQIQAVNSSSDSRACRGQAPTQTNSSDVVTPDIGIPPLVPAGCGSGGPGDSGTPNTIGGITLLGLLPLVCNADDSNGSQTAAPYGVREALSVFALVVPATDSALTKVTAGAAESSAVAPAAGPGDDGGGGGGGGDDGGGGGGGGNAGDGDGNAGDGDGDDGGNAGDGDGGNAGDRAGGDGAPECSDGIDNDGDGKIDFPNDPECSSRSDDSEADGALAFTGADLLLIALAGALALAGGLALRNVVIRSARLAA